jgi:hypothetical protein
MRGEAGSLTIDFRPGAVIPLQGDSRRERTQGPAKRCGILSLQGEVAEWLKAAPC